MRNRVSSAERSPYWTKHRTSPRVPARWSATRRISAMASVLLVGVLVGIVAVTLCPAAPPYEIKQTPTPCFVAKDGWFDSMLASRAALQADEAAGGRPNPKVSFHGDIVRGRQPARAISVPIHGVEVVYLYVTGAPEVEYGAGDWIAPRAIGATGKETLLCSAKFLKIEQGFHTVDCSLRSRVDPPLMIADETFEHGINLQAPGKIRIKLPAATVRFEARIGIDDWVDPETYKLPQPYYYQPQHFSTVALQVMRSWLTVMPGKVRSCVGCHEDNTDTPPAAAPTTMALRRGPVGITPWYGPPRGFSFAREVQPVLDKYCVSCHDGSPAKDGIVLSDLRADQNIVWAYRHGNPKLIRFEDTPFDELTRKYSGLFSPSYIALREQIRVGGLESDLHLLPPMEFHADTSRLVQLLTKGHHGVKLSPEAWDRLVTWIDLNAPSHGTWSEFTRIPGDQEERRCEIRAMYGGRSGNGEAIVPGDPPFGGDLTPVIPEPEPTNSASRPPQASDRIHETTFVRDTSGWLDHAVASNPAATLEKRLQTRAHGARKPQSKTLTIDMGNGVSMRLVRIPAGAGGDASSIDQPFWIGCNEVTNRQYAQDEDDRGTQLVANPRIESPLSLQVLFNRPLRLQSSDMTKAFRSYHPTLADARCEPSLLLP